MHAVFRASYHFCVICKNINKDKCINNVTSDYVLQWKRDVYSMVLKLCKNDYSTTSDSNEFLSSNEMELLTGYFDTS